MRTSKPFSTISYNTTDFLIVKLDELLKRGVVDFWAFIEHLPEDDETKKHKHLFIVPSRLMDSSAFISALLEVDVLYPLNKPLGCMPCRSSKFSDWFLYSIHDKRYLLSKGQSRKYSYCADDFVCSNIDYFNDLRHQIDFSKLRGTQFLVDALENGVSFESLVRNGQIPIQLLKQYEYAYYMLSGRFTYRDEHLGHEIEENPSK